MDVNPGSYLVKWKRGSMHSPPLAAGSCYTSNTLIISATYKYISQPTHIPLSEQYGSDSCTLLVTFSECLRKGYVGHIRPDTWQKASRLAEDELSNLCPETAGG